jgi:hypothetical protein
VTNIGVVNRDRAIGDEPVGSFNDDLAFPAILIFREERSPTQNRVYHFSRSVTYPSGFLQKRALSLAPIPYPVNVSRQFNVSRG